MMIYYLIGSGGNRYCLFLVGSFVCACSPGYMRTSSGCIETDECSNNNGGCEQLCINLRKFCWF